MPATRLPHALRTRARRPAAWRQALPLSVVNVLQARDVEHRLGQQLLELRLLVLERLQPVGLRDNHAGELRIPLVEARRADPLPAEQSTLAPLAYYSQRIALITCTPKESRSSLANLSLIDVAPKTTKYYAKSCGEKTERKKKARNMLGCCSRLSVKPCALAFDKPATLSNVT